MTQQDRPAIVVKSLLIPKAKAEPKRKPRRKPKAPPSKRRDRTSTVQVMVSSQLQRSPRWVVRSLVGLLLLSTAGLVGMGGWVAIQLIVNPGSVSWLSWMLPEWNRGSLSKNLLQTLPEIRANAEQAGLRLGVPLTLTTSESTTAASTTQDLLIPFLTADQQIVELRVYRPQTTGRDQQLTLVDQFTVTGPQEFEAIAPLVRAKAANPGSTRRLPLTALSPVEGNPTSADVWVNLSGEWRKGSSRLLYGRLLRYDHSQSRLEPVLNWSSPAAQLPIWQAITGEGSPELVVDQSLGLEPHIQIYQVKTRPSRLNAVTLEPISLRSPALDDPTFENALVLARSGLWTPAQQMMERAKQNLESIWSPAAQAQLDLIAFHAQVTQAQAKRTWASSSQQIRTLLIDGQWASAFTTLQPILERGYEFSRLLGNTSRLQQQVETVLRIDPNQPEVLAWGALMVADQQNRAAAIAWVQKHQSNATTNPQILQALNLLERPSIANRPANLTGSNSPQATEVAIATPNPSHASQLIGTATPTASITAADWQWQQPTAPTLDKQQTWYQIQVNSFYDGQRWQRSPFAGLTPPTATNLTSFWQTLGLAQTPTLQVIVWAENAPPQVIQASVEAVQLRNGSLQLLAIGEAASRSPSASLPPLAMTLNTLPWQTPQTLTLVELYQQQPTWVAQILPNLWQELQQAGQVSSIPDSEPAALLAEVGNLPVQLIDLTGNNQSEALITVQPGLLSQSRYATGTLTAPSIAIFSTQGTLLQREDLGRSLIGITIPQSSTTAALVVHEAQGYQLRRWSAQNQRFE